MKFEPFPEDLLGKPIEELDQFVYEKVIWKWSHFFVDEQKSLDILPRF